MLEKSLPSEYYRSAEIFAKERERIFSREWVCAGRADELPPAGEVRVLEVFGESLLIVRTKEGRLGAHYNVCRHRGARLCTAEEDGGKLAAPKGGTAVSIRCPYHSWCYELDGRVRSAPFLGESDDFDPAAFGLHPVAVDTWGGWLFVNLSPERVDAGLTLAAQLDGIPERVARYPLADLLTARRIVYDVRANWKVIVENYNECYHCSGVHPELCRIVPAFREKGGGNLDWDAGVPQAEGTFTFTATGRSDRAPFPGLDADEQVRHKGELATRTS